LLSIIQALEALDPLGDEDEAMDLRIALRNAAAFHLAAAVHGFDAPKDCEACSSEALWWAPRAHVFTAMDGISEVSKQRFL